MCPHVCGEQVVPAFAADLVQRTVVVTNSLQLRDLCHERGINMRKLALVRACFKRDSRLSSLLLTDMIARFSKVALRNMMRKVSPVNVILNSLYSADMTPGAVSSDLWKYL